MAEMLIIDQHNKPQKDTVTLTSEFDNDGMTIKIRNEKLEPIGHIVLAREEVAALLMLDFDPRN